MARWKAITIIVGILVMIYGGFFFAQAQQSPPARGGRPGDQDSRMEQMIDMMFRDMDTNHDGKISKSEWMAFYEWRFKRLDKNGDGFITRDEVKTDMIEAMKAQQQQRGRPPE